MTVSDRIYITLCVLFSASVITVNLTYQKIVHVPIIGGLVLSVGAMLYPVTFFITDLIAEFFDKKKAEFCVRVAMLANIYVVLVVYIMNLLPTASWSKVDQAMFNQMFGSSGLAFIGSTVACYTSQYVDIKLYLWIRKITKSKYLWLRNNGSTIISLFIDTFLSLSFIVIFGIIDKERLYTLVTNSYIFKVLFTVAATPLFYLLYNRIKKYAKD